MVKPGEKRGGDPGALPSHNAQRALLSLLQFSDGLFPAGGYAHSLGLEALVDAGRVRDRGDVEDFCRSHLHASAGPCDGGAVVLALGHRGRPPDRPQLHALDTAFDAMKPVAETRNASRQMGRQTLRVASQVTQHRRLLEAWDELEAGRLRGHHALVFGLVGATQGWRAVPAVEAFLYSTAALLVGAALRLLPLGQLEGQRILWSLGPDIQRLSTAAAETRSVEDLWSFAPTVEIAAMRHATLDARLFRS